MKRELAITPELVVQILRDGREQPPFRVDGGLPADARFVAVRYEPAPNPDLPEGAARIVLTFEAESWKTEEPLRPTLVEREAEHEDIAEASRLLSRARYLLSRRRRWRDGAGV